MIRITFLILFGLLSSYTGVSALVERTTYKPAMSEVEAAAKPCLPGGSKQPINDHYTCPVGDFGGTNDSALSKQAIECAVQMSLSFYTIDEEAKLWKKQLQTSRETNFDIWNEDIQKTVRTFGEKYDSVCHIANWTIGEDEPIACAKLTTFFPETTCNTLAEKKYLALENVGYILASKGISKGYQNDKDIFLDTQKTKYSTLLEKWTSYMVMVGNAVTKMTAYIKNAVK